MAALLGKLPLAAAPAPAVVAAEPAWATASETPDLGRKGAYEVGTRMDALKLTARPGLAGPAPASLAMRLFYPTAATTRGKTAGDGQPAYWRGFHRGREVGMTLKHRKAGE